MTTHEVASRLVELCRKGDFEAAQRELYSDDVVSIEPQATPQFEKETKGLKKVLEKGEKFHEMTSEIRNINVSEPVMAGNSFAISMRMDMIMKDGSTMDGAELCVYKVKDGKIVSEEFIM